MQLTPGVAALVLVAALCHASWNALVKSGSDRLVGLTLVNAVGAVLAGAALPLVGLPAEASRPWLAGSVALHLGYYGFLIEAYRHGDLSRVYPLARGLSPLLVMFGAQALAGEWPGTLALAGVALASAGIASLAFERGLPWRGDPRGLAFAVGTGLWIAAYTVVDGMGVRRSGYAPSYIAWLFFIDGLPLVAVMVVRRWGRVWSSVRGGLGGGLAGGVLQITAYGIVIWALSRSPMAAVSTLRETSVLFAAVIGGALLGEPFARRRIWAAAAVMCGLAALHL